MKTFLTMLFAVFFTTPALAIDPGVAKGTLQVRGTTIKLTHAYAFNDRKELRILVVDREMPKRVLPGIEFLMVAQLSREDNLRGLLIQYDAQDQKRTIVTLLHPVVHGRSAGVVRNIVVAGNRVTGRLENGGLRDIPYIEYSATFSAPVFKAAR